MTQEPPCWFCNKPVDKGYCCEEFDFAPYHKDCGDKISRNACAICIGEGLEPCCKDEESND
jgi:hypothetical protein|tara:strand:- start:1027 stop:1209 length:183 start_codon:yes stop_codon:yes gene_type:complete